MKKVPSLISAKILISFLSLSLLLLISAKLKAQIQIPCNQPDNFTYIGSLNGNEYFVSDYTISAAGIFDDATANGGHAATISSSAENELIRQGLPWFSFIGLSDIGNEGNFTWGTGEPLDFTNWGPTEPNGGLNENSVEMNPYNGVWNDVSSYFVRNYVLEVEGDDADCDDVTDLCDLRIGGDDSVDNNNDGLADIVNPPAYEDILEAWKCGNGRSNKVLVTVNPNNPHTICVNYNSVDAHIANGGWLGPISSCEENEGMISPETLFLESQQSLMEDLDVFPNPADNQIEIRIGWFAENHNTQVLIYNQLGMLMHQETTSNAVLKVDISGAKYSNGLYLIKVKQGERQYSKRLVIVK